MHSKFGSIEFYIALQCLQFIQSLFRIRGKTFVTKCRSGMSKQVDGFIAFSEDSLAALLVCHGIAIWLNIWWKLGTKLKFHETEEKSFALESNESLVPKTSQLV